MSTALETAPSKPAPMAKTYVGDFRRFGEFGVAYEVIGIDDDLVATVRVLESGETLSYPLDSILSDPAA